MQARIIFVVVSFAISVFAVPVAVPAPEALGVSAAIENQPVVTRDEEFYPPGGSDGYGL